MKKLFILIVLLLVLGVAWWLISPLFIDKQVEESLPTEMENGTAKMTAQQIQIPMIVKAGNFRDADNFHKGSGQAIIYRHDGSYILRLENLQVTNGPDLYVYLSPHSNPSTPAEVKTQGFINLARLKGNMGNQNYDIDIGVKTDIDQFNSVVIYCRAFDVTFAVASLTIQ